MRQTHGSAVGAGGEVAGFEGVVRAAHVAAALRVFALWMWGHSVFLLVFTQNKGEAMLRPYI